MANHLKLITIVLPNTITNTIIANSSKVIASFDPSGYCYFFQSNENGCLSRPDVICPHRVGFLLNALVY